jgi:2-desacetyl-2-hydroxyethyl bacteriochlorophyllide A dehydrogenase
MKGIVCQKPNEFSFVDVERPSFQQGEALVKIRRIGICGTDLHAFQGNQPYFTYPRVLGHELSGTIEEIGENEQGLHKGDQVAVIPYIECGECVACKRGKTNCCTDMKVLGVHVDGGMREAISVPVHHLIKAEGISLDQAALLEPLCIGAHAVKRSSLMEGESVLVIGAGPIGLGVMKFAKQQGARVIAMDINEERLEFCKKWANVDEIVYGQNQPVQDLSDLTNGEFPTVVFDATGNVHSMTESFNYVAHGGKLVFVGLVKQSITFSDPDFHKKELTLMGSRNATKADFEYVLNVIQSGQIDVGPYISHRCKFEDMIEEFEDWLKPESKVIKAIVEL